MQDGTIPRQAGAKEILVEKICRNNMRRIHMKSIAPCIQQYTISAQLFDKVLNEFPKEELTKSPGRDSNPMIWIAGHVVQSRATLLNMLGVKKETGWGELFGRGAKRPDDASHYPKMDEILSVWNEIAGGFTGRLIALTEQDLEREAPIQLPGPDNTICNAITFFAFHEIFHIGQMAYLSKWLGRGQLVG